MVKIGAEIVRRDAPLLGGWVVKIGGVDIEKIYRTPLGGGWGSK